MENFEKLLKRVEKNFLEKDERKKVEYTYKDMNFEVLTFNRAEKAELLFSWSGEEHNLKAAYNWMKPWIYKAFQLKELAIKAKEEGYIKTYYEVMDYLFDPEDIPIIIDFIAKINDMKNMTKEVNELQKK